MLVCESVNNCGVVMLPSTLSKLVRQRSEELLAQPEHVILIAQAYSLATLVVGKALGPYIEDHEMMLAHARFSPVRYESRHGEATHAKRLSHAAWLVRESKSRPADAFRLLGTYGGIREYDWLINGKKHPIYGDGAERPQFHPSERDVKFAQAKVEALRLLIAKENTIGFDVALGVLGYLEGALWSTGKYPIDHFRNFGLDTSTTH